MGKKIIFIDSSKTAKIRYMTGYNYTDQTFYVDYWDTEKIFIDKARIRYPIDDTVIFLSDGDRDFNDIYVRSRKYKAPMNLRVKAQQGSPDGLLYAHISTAFKIFDDVNAQCKSEGKAPVWMLQFDLDDGDMNAVLRNTLDKVFDAFSCSGPRSEMMISKLYGDYHPEALYNMMVKNLIKRDHKAPLIDVDKLDFRHMYPESLLTEEGKAHYDKMYIIAGRGSGKTELARKMMLNYIKTGEMPKEENMKMINFRKSLEYLRRDKKHPNKFNIKFKYSPIIRTIEFQGATKKDLLSDALIENVLIIASQMMGDCVVKVIFNLKNKMTIIFPWKHELPEKTIVKANGLDAFDILNGYSIAKAKMMCSEDGYEWLSKLRKSGKVDV